MSGCLPIWTSDNSGIYPLWIGEDVTPIFVEVGPPCLTFTSADQNIAFTNSENRVLFTSQAVEITFTQTCL